MLLTVGAQKQVFNQLDVQDPQWPGIVKFKSTGSFGRCFSGCSQSASKVLATDGFVIYTATLWSQNVCFDGITTAGKKIDAIAFAQKGN